jgi:DNA repair protein RecN (Recombination protein N)
VHAVEQARMCVDQGADGEPLGRKLWEAGKILAKIGNIPEMQQLAESAHDLAAKLDDLSYQLGRAGSGLEVDEADLEAAQSRLAGYQELMRKMAVHDIDGLLAEYDRLGGELQFLSSAQAEVATILEKLKLACVSLKAAAEKIAKARRKAKPVVKDRIESELHELAMPGATIDMEFVPVNRPIPALELGLFGPAAAEIWAECAELLSGLTEQGSERTQFLLAANPGEAMLPIQKIASGGEVSRIMLALKKALAAGADTCILVFDEIDTGISGRVADVVGRKMRELSQDFQVICISHLAQVAAYADKHFLVHKSSKGDRTESTITKLTDEKAQEEVARLLSGDEVTASSLANAKQLISKARGNASAPKPPQKGGARSDWTSGPRPGKTSGGRNL